MKTYEQLLEEMIETLECKLEVIETSESYGDILSQIEDFESIVKGYKEAVKLKQDKSST